METATVALTIAARTAATSSSWRTWCTRLNRTTTTKDTRSLVGSAPSASRARHGNAAASGSCAGVCVSGIRAAAGRACQRGGDDAVGRHRRPFDAGDLVVVVADRRQTVATGHARGGGRWRDG